MQQSVLKPPETGCQDRQDKLKIDDPVDVLKDVGATPRASEIACLEAIVTRLETDLGPMQVRARAGRLVTSIRCADCLIRTTAARALPLSRARSASESLSHGPRGRMIAVEDSLRETAHARGPVRWTGCWRERLTRGPAQKGYTVEGP